MGLARLIRFANRALISTSTSILQSRSSTCPSRLYATAALREIPYSPTAANILRILRNEIEYRNELSPPKQPETAYEAFEVDGRPGEQWVSMRKRIVVGGEEIKLEATMFDGMERVTREGDKGLEEDTRLHITLLVGVSKDNAANDRSLEFLCSAWPDRLEILKVYFVDSQTTTVTAPPYMGPDFRELSRELQKELGEFLAERGVDDKLCDFLHKYMSNKDKIELIRWLGKVAGQKFDPELVGLVVMKLIHWMGRFKVSPDGVTCRDEKVSAFARERNVPIVVLTSGMIIWPTF